MRLCFVVGVVAICINGVAVDVRSVQYICVLCYLHVMLFMCVYAVVDVVVADVCDVAVVADGDCVWWCWGRVGCSVVVVVVVYDCVGVIVVGGAVVAVVTIGVCSIGVGDVADVGYFGVIVGCIAVDAVVVVVGAVVHLCMLSIVIFTLILWLVWVYCWC